MLHSPEGIGFCAVVALARGLRAWYTCLVRTRGDTAHVEPDDGIGPERAVEAGAVLRLPLPLDGGFLRRQKPVRLRPLARTAGGRGTEPRPALLSLHPGSWSASPAQSAGPAAERLRIAAGRVRGRAGPRA